MSLDGAQLNYVNADGIPVSYTAKGRKFNVGSLLGCDLVLPNAERLHCEIQCDAFGRVTICNHSSNEPILLNDQIVQPTAKRPLLHGARIKILNELYTWHFPHVDAAKTPSRPPPEQAANSSPSLKGHKQRRQFDNRLTVHNFRYSIHSDDEGNTSIESRQLKTSTSSNEADSTDVDQLKRSMTPVSTEVDDTMLKVDLVEATQNKENTSTPSNKLLLELCARSDVVITSFSPRETGVKIEKSFTCVKRPSTGLGLLSAATTPMSITPKIVLSTHKDDSYSSRAMECSTPSTSTKSLASKRQTSMYLIDLTTPQRLRPTLSGTPKQTLSSGSVISVNSTAQSSDDSPMVIDITNSSTPSTSTPTKKLHQSCLSAKTQKQRNLETSDTPKRTPQSLIKRALLTSAKKQLSTETTSNQATPARKSLLDGRRQCLTAPRRLPFHPQPQWRTPPRRQFTDKPGKAPLTTPRRHPPSICLNSPRDTKISQVRKSLASAAKMSSGVEMTNKLVGEARRALNLPKQNSPQHISSPKIDRLPEVGNEPNLNEGSEAELSCTFIIDDEGSEGPASETALKCNDGEEKPFFEGMINVIHDLDTSQSGQAAVNICEEGSIDVKVNLIQEDTEKHNPDRTFDADQDQELKKAAHQTITEEEVASVSNAELGENASGVINEPDSVVTKEEIIQMETKLSELPSHRDSIPCKGTPELNIVTVEDVIERPDPKENASELSQELNAVDDIAEKFQPSEAAMQLAKDLSPVETTDDIIELQKTVPELAYELDPVELIEESIDQKTASELPIDSEDIIEKTEPLETTPELADDLHPFEVIGETLEPQEPISDLPKVSDPVEITEDSIEKPEPLETVSELAKVLHPVEVIGETPELQETLIELPKNSKPPDTTEEITEKPVTPEAVPELARDLDTVEVMDLQETALELSNSDPVDAIKEITASPENPETAFELPKDLGVVEVIGETPKPQKTALESPKYLESIEAIEDNIENPESPETVAELTSDSAPVEIIEDNICDEVPTFSEAARSEAIDNVPEDPICEEVPVTIKDNIQLLASPLNGKKSGAQSSQNTTGTLMTPRRSTRRASMDASNKLEKQLSRPARRASCSGTLENQGNDLTVATPKRNRRLTEELSTPTRKSLRLQNATPKRKAPVDESVGDMGVIVEEEDAPQQDTNKLPADEDYGSELPDDENDELDRIDFHGMRELLKTPKNCSTPRFKGLREMMRTPKMLSSPILDHIDELLEGDSSDSTATPKRRLPVKCINLELIETETQDKYFKTPRGKNIMLPNEPASAVLKTREKSLATTTQYDLNGTNNTLHLDKIFDDMLVTDATIPDEHSEVEINVTTVSAANSTTIDPLVASTSAAPSLGPSDTVNSETLMTVGDLEVSNRDPLTSTALKPGNNADMKAQQRERKSYNLCEVSGIQMLDQSSNSMFSEKLIVTGIDSRDVTFEETKASIINVRTPRKSTLEDNSDTDSMVGLGEPLVLTDDAEDGEVATEDNPKLDESNAKSALTEESPGSQPEKNDIKCITILDRDITAIEDESINLDTSQTNSQTTITSIAENTSMPELSIQKISIIESTLTTNSDAMIDVTIDKRKSTIDTINASEQDSVNLIGSENSLCEDICKMSASSKDVSVTEAFNYYVDNSLMTSHKDEREELKKSKQLETLGPEKNMPTIAKEAEVLNCEISSECYVDVEDKSSIIDLNRSEDEDVVTEASVQNKSIEKTTSSNDDIDPETNYANIQNVDVDLTYSKKKSNSLVLDTSTSTENITDIQSGDLEELLLEKEYSTNQKLKEEHLTSLTSPIKELNKCESLVEISSENSLKQPVLNTSSDDILPRSSEESSADTNEKPVSSVDPALPKLNATIAGDEADTLGDTEERNDKLSDEEVVEDAISLTSNIIASHNKNLIEDESVIELKASLDDEVVKTAEDSAKAAHQNSMITEGTSQAQSGQGNETAMADIEDSIIDLDASNLVDEDEGADDQREVEEPTITLKYTTKTQIVQDKVRDVDESLVASGKSVMGTGNSALGEVESMETDADESVIELDEEEDINKRPVFEIVKEELSKEQTNQVKITSSETISTDIIDINLPHIIDEADEVIGSTDLRTATEELSVEESKKDEEKIKGENKSNEVLKENLSDLTASKNVECVNPLEVHGKDQEAHDEIVQNATASLAKEEDVNELNISCNAQENENMKASSEPLKGSTSRKSENMESADKSLSKDIPAIQAEAEITLQSTTEISNVPVLITNARESDGEEEQYQAKSEAPKNEIESMTEDREMECLPMDSKESSNNKDITCLEALETRKNVQQMETRKDKESIDTREESLNSSEDEEKSDEAENKPMKEQPIEIDAVIKLEDSTVESNIISDPCSSEVLSSEEAAVIDLDDSTADSGSVTDPICEAFVKEDVVIELNESSTESTSGVDKLTEITNVEAVLLQAPQKKSSIEGPAENKTFDTRPAASECNDKETVTTETKQEDKTKTPDKISDEEVKALPKTETVLEKALPHIAEGIANQDKEQAEDIVKEKDTSKPNAKVEEPKSRHRSTPSDATQSLQTSEVELDSRRTECTIDNETEKMLSDTVNFTESVNAEQGKIETLETESNEESELHKLEDPGSNPIDPIVEELLEEQIPEDVHAEKIDTRFKANRLARNPQTNANETISNEAVDNSENIAEEESKSAKPKRRGRKVVEINVKDTLTEDPVSHTKDKSEESDERLKPKPRARKEEKISDEEIIEERERVEEKSKEANEMVKPKRRGRKEEKISDEEIIEECEREEEQLTEQSKTKRRSRTVTEDETKEGKTLEADFVEQPTDLSKTRRKRVQKGTTEVESKGATEKIIDDLDKPIKRGRRPTTDIDKTSEDIRQTAKPKRGAQHFSVEVVAADLVESPTEELVTEKPKRRGRKASADPVERKPTRTSRKASAETLERQAPVHTQLTMIKEAAEPLSKILHAEELAPQVTPIVKRRGRPPSALVEEATPVKSAKATETRKRRKALAVAEQPAESVVQKIKLLARKDSTDAMHSNDTDSADKPAKLRRKDSSDVEHIALTEVSEITGVSAIVATNIPKKPQRRIPKPSAHLEATAEDPPPSAKKANARRGRKASVVEELELPKDLSVTTGTVVAAILVSPHKVNSEDEMTPRRREGRNLPRKNYDETSDEEKRGSASCPRRTRKPTGSKSAKTTGVATPPLPKPSTPQKPTIVETIELTISQTPGPTTALPEPTTSPRREGRNVPRKNYSETSDDDKPGTSRGRRVRQPTAKALELLVDMASTKRPATPKRRKAKDNEEQPQEKKLASEDPEPVVSKPRGGARRKAAKEDDETEIIKIEPQVTKRGGRSRKESATTQREEPEQAEQEQEPKLTAAKRNVRGTSSSRKTKAVTPLEDASEEQPTAKKPRRGGSRAVTPVTVEYVEIAVEQAPAAKKTPAGRGRGRQMQTVEEVDTVPETAAPTRGGRARKVHFETAVESLPEKAEAPKRTTRSRRK